MSSIWCIRPEEDKVDLTFTDAEGVPHPFWIKLKRRLTVGEERKVMTAGWRGIKNTQPGPGGQEGGTEVKIDWRAQSFARAEAYLRDWSLTDDDMKKLPCTLDVIESLNPDVFVLIEEAITRHVETAEEEKKLKSGSNAPSAMSV